MKLYRKRPVIVEAVQFDGSNHSEIADFIGDSMFDGGDNFGSEFYVQTVDGPLFASPGDFIVKTVFGGYERWGRGNFAASFEEL